MRRAFVSQSRCSVETPGAQQASHSRCSLSPGKKVPVRPVPPPTPQLAESRIKSSVRAKASGGRLLLLTGSQLTDVVFSSFPSSLGPPLQPAAFGSPASPWPHAAEQSRRKTRPLSSAPLRFAGAFASCFLSTARPEKFSRLPRIQASQRRKHQPKLAALLSSAPPRAENPRRLPGQRRAGLSRVEGCRRTRQLSGLEGIKQPRRKSCPKVSRSCPVPRPTLLLWHNRQLLHDFLAFGSFCAALV